MNQSQIRIRFSLALSLLLDDERSSSLIFYVQVSQFFSLGIPSAIDFALGRREVELGRVGIRGLVSFPCLRKRPGLL